jgi:pyrophosphatase PpaX
VRPHHPIAVLLDLDGTLVDTVPLILESVRYAFQDRDRRPTDAEWIAGIGTPLRVQLVPFTDGPDDLEAVVARYRVHQRAHHDRMTRAYVGALEAVRTIKDRGHPVAVVTGKLGEPAARTLAFVGLAPFVDALVGSDSCPRHKPDPQPVLLALERLGRTPGEALFLGDSPIDVRAGNAAGVTSVGALWGACTREALVAAEPHHLLESVEALPALVALLSARRPQPGCG